MWKDITGHSDIVDLLRSYCSSEKVPHAFLFAGPLGTGKTRMAKEFFKALNCLEHSNGDTCDKCRSCLKVIAGTHPDLSELNPLERWIKVDDVRKVLADVGLKPFEARMKCIIIEPAELLNTESANALLKTLEEPPEHTMIILISHRPKLLLPTIISRCQPVRFNNMEETDLYQSGTGSKKKDASALKDDVISLFKGSDAALLAKKYFDSEGWDLLPEMLVIVESVIRDIMLMRLGGEKVVNAEILKIPMRDASIEDFENIASLIKAIRRGVNENINIRIAATELFIMLSRLAGKGC